MVEPVISPMYFMLAIDVPTVVGKVMFKEAVPFVTLTMYEFPLDNVILIVPFVTLFP